jgi:hypothetical protein
MIFLAGRIERTPITDHGQLVTYGGQTKEITLDDVPHALCPSQMLSSSLPLSS